MPFGGLNLSSVVECIDGTVIFLRLIRQISYPSFVQPASGHHSQLRNGPCTSIVEIHL